MKNGIKITQKTFTNDEGKRIAFCNATIYIDGVSVRVTPAKDDKRVFNLVCKNMGYVVGEVGDLADVPEKITEIGE